MSPIYFFNHMCFSILKKQKSGLSLVAVIVLMTVLGLVAALGTAMLGTASIGTVRIGQSAQALALANAGKEWYLEQLKTDTDWFDQTNVNRSFGAGSFEIQIGAVSIDDAPNIPPDQVMPDTRVTEVKFTSLGHISTRDGQTVQRRQVITAQKLAPAFLFALYQGSDPGQNLKIKDTSTIDGDVWSRGSVNIEAGSFVNNGLVFIPDTKTVTGAVSKKILQPFPVMPVINTLFYRVLLNSYDALIETADRKPPGGIGKDTNLTLNGDVILKQIFSTSGNNVTITGNGIIVAFWDIKLHEKGSGSLTVTPSGGDILFLAGRNVIVGNKKKNPTVILERELNGTGICRLYSEGLFRSGPTIEVGGINPGGRGKKKKKKKRGGIQRPPPQGDQSAMVLGKNTTLHGVRIYARKRLTVKKKAIVDQRSLLYLDRSLSGGNRWLEILDSGTFVAGSVISVGPNSNNLRIRKGAAVDGLVYSGGIAGRRMELEQCTIRGTVVSSRYQKNKIKQATITYDPTVIPNPPPEGFQGFVIKKPNSVDSL